jgi:hypothetical protein
MLFSSSVLNYYPPPYDIKTEEIFEYPTLFLIGQVKEKHIPE